MFVSSGFRILVLIVGVALFVGCGDPTLHPITGKVTLGGKPYERLIVYFRPINQAVNKFNLGVGETDGQGILKMRSSAGDGIPTGKYRVSFTCLVQVGGKKVAVGLDEKADDNPNFKTKELVPELYTDGENSPVEFEVKGNGEDVFEYDIPLK